MHAKRIPALVATAAVLFPYAAALAQQAHFDLKPLLELKQSMTVAELTGDFHAIKVSAGTMDYNSIWGFSMLSGLGGGSSTELEHFFKLYDLLWTKGDVVGLGGEAFLVTYAFDVQEFGAVFNHSKESKTPVLRLRLVKLSTVQSVTPYGDVTPEELKKLFSPPADEPKPGDQAAALSNVKQISLAMIMYCADYDDVMPYVQSTNTAKYVTFPYIKNEALWSTGNPNGSRFLLNMAVAGVNSSDVPSPAETVMYYESAPWPDGRRAVSFMDSHSKLLSEEEWQKVKPTLLLRIKKSAKPLPANYPGPGK